MPWMITAFALGSLAGGLVGGWLAGLWLGLAAAVVAGGAFIVVTEVRIARQR